MRPIYKKKAFLEKKSHIILTVELLPEAIYFQITYQIQIYHRPTTYDVLILRAMNNAG